MKGIPNRIGNLSINLFGRSGLLSIPLPSPTTLLVALVLGPALLLAARSYQPSIAFADTGEQQAIVQVYEIDNPNAGPDETADPAACDIGLLGICLPF